MSRRHRMGWATKAGAKTMARWRRRKAAIIQDRGRFCEKCGRYQASLDLHHLDPVGCGGQVLPQTDDRLLLLCKPCHSWHHKSAGGRAWQDWLQGEWGHQ